MSVDLTGELPGLLYDKRDHIAYITINRPERANTLHSSMVEPIKAIWAEVRDDPWIRCSVVTAAGDRHFSTGADVGAVASRAASPPARVRSARRCTGRRARTACGSRPSPR